MRDAVRRLLCRGLHWPWWRTGRVTRSDGRRTLYLYRECARCGRTWVVRER